MLCWGAAGRPRGYTWRWHMCSSEVRCELWSNRANSTPGLSHVGDCPWGSPTNLKGKACRQGSNSHDDVIKWRLFSCYWPFVQGIHRSPVNSPHNGQCRGAFMFSLISARTNDWVNNRDADDLRRHRAHYDVTVMYQGIRSSHLNVQSRPT